jgi:hypothetical protein
VEGERLGGRGSDGWTMLRMKVKRWRNKTTESEVWAKIVWEAPTRAVMPRSK